MHWTICAILLGFEFVPIPSGKRTRDTASNKGDSTLLKRKHAWQLTREQFLKSVRNGRDFKRIGTTTNTTAVLRRVKDWTRLDNLASDWHQGRVATAIALGKSVPDIVLSDYPNLFG